MVQWTKLSKKTNSDLRLAFSVQQFVYVSLCKGNKHVQSPHKWITHSQHLSTVSKKHFYQGIEWYWQSQCDLRGLAWHDMKQRFYVVCQTFGKKQINATWQHYIKSFCVLIFLFCLCTFVWGVQSSSRGPGGAELARTMWESKEETAHVIFSLQFLLWLQKEAASLQTISYGNIIHHSRQVRLLHLPHSFSSNLQLDPWILLRWNQHCHGCANLQNIGLMCLN